MPALGPALTREIRHLTSAYHAYPGPASNPPSEVLAWYGAQQARALEAAAAGADTGGTGGGALDRRTFLGRSAVIGAGAVGAGLLAGPSRAFADTASPKVIVVGAGLAGLSCTYRLRQHGIPAVLHEAQERIGGRCYSIRDFFDAGQTAEHGGQYIDTRHTQFRALATELGVELIDTFAQSFPEGSNNYRWVDGALRSSDEVFADYGLFLDRLKADYMRVGDYHWNKASPAAVAIDNKPMTTWFDRNLPGGSDSLLGRAISVFQQSFFGVEPSEMSTINLFEAFIAPYPGANERYRVAGGNDGMVHALEAALPADAIKRGRVLDAAWTRSDGRIGLKFCDGDGDVIADRVVFALPFTTLRDVDTSKLVLTDRRRQAIDELIMGSNAKLNMQFDQSFASLDWGASFFSDEPHYVTWDTTYGQVNPRPRTPVLTIYNGGIEGATYPARVAHGPAPYGVVDAALANLERGVTGITDAWGGKAYLDSWVDDPWARGSYAGFGPGQYTAYWGFLKKHEGNAFFAGEHTSTHSQGYLNGGVESGERAAGQVRRSLGL